MSVYLSVTLFLFSSFNAPQLAQNSKKWGNRQKTICDDLGGSSKIVENSCQF